MPFTVAVTACAFITGQLLNPKHHNGNGNGNALRRLHLS
jgi:hypothetical protein